MTNAAQDTFQEEPEEIMERLALSDADADLSLGVPEETPSDSEIGEKRKATYVLGVPIKGKMHAYTEATAGKVPERARRASMVPVVDLSSVRKPFSKTECTLADIQKVVDKRNASGKPRTAISLFTGAGDTLTGLRMAGWNVPYAAEFVNNAVETIGLNYRTRPIWPEDVLASAKVVAEEMNLPVNAPVAVLPGEVSSFTKRDEAVVTTKDSSYRGKEIKGGVDWEETQQRLGKRFAEFRSRVSHHAHRALGERDLDAIYVWADDIRGLDGGAVLEFLGAERGEIDLVEGEPPCSSFSLAGKREAKWGKRSRYSDERVQSTNSLFDEFVRMVKEIHPKAWVAENVPGMVAGEEPRRYTENILNATREDGYNCDWKLLNANDFECVQRRKRLFLHGILSDVKDAAGNEILPAWPKPSKNSYVLRDALEAAKSRNTEEMLRLVSLERHELGRTWEKLPFGTSAENKQFMASRCHPDLPCPTITVVGARDISAAGPMHPFEKRKFTVAELKAIFGYPIDFQFGGHVTQAAERMARSVPPPISAALSRAIISNLDRAA